MWAWWMSVAMAGPPAGVDLEDLDAWEQGARALRDGPDGCWTFRGDASVRAVVFRAPMLYRSASEQITEYTGPFEGHLEQGRWHSFTHTLTGPDDDSLDLDPQLVPMIGRLNRDAMQTQEAPPEPEPSERGVSVSIGGSAGGGSRQAVSMVDRVLDAIDPAATTSYAQWADSPRGVTLVQDVPLDESASADTVTLTTFFGVPADRTLPGAAPATSLSMVFPKRMRVGEGLLKATLKEPQLHVRATVVDEQAMPTVERLSVVVGALGFTVGYEQTLRYRQALRCPPAQIPPEDADPP